MRRKELNGNNLNVVIHDNAKSTTWGFNKVAKIVEQSLEVIENFLYSKETIVKKAQHPVIELDIHFCGDAKMKSLNTDFRGKPKTTDVLSFPGYESLRQGSDEMIFPGPVHLGDIIISREVAKKQAKEFSLPVEQEVIHLIVHGFLHLLGWDHEISELEEEIMEKHEKAILNKIRNKRTK